MLGGFFYQHLARGSRRVVFDGLEPAERFSDSIQFDFFEYVYHHVLRKEDEWAAREWLREKYRAFEAQVLAHRYDHRHVGCLYLYTTPQVMLDELLAQPISQGDIFANANTIILMGRTRYNGRLGRALAVVKHRGSACSEDILPYRITEEGFRFRMSLTIDLSGRTAMVTGSSQGIGAEIARLLHRAGARVVLNHPDASGGPVHRDAEALRDELSASRPDSALVVAADVSDPSAVEAMMQRVGQEWGGLDILVNNAGILRDRSIAKMTPDEWRSVIDVDLSGVFYCCKFGLEILRDGGSIVSIGSLAARMGFHGQSNYAAAKAGVHALTRVLARECARQIDPGQRRRAGRDRDAHDGAGQ